jgi:GT2 family glycosyltransferase
MNLPLTVELSIIIVTYNPGPILLSCLESLRPHLSDASTEVFLVDNASQDEVVEQVRRDFPEIKIILNTENRGFAAANNQGLAAASGDYLVLLNPDTRIRGDAIRQLQSFLMSHPRAGIVGPRTLDVNHRVALTAYGPYRLLTILWQYLGLDRIFPYLVYGKYRYDCEHAEQPFTVSWIQASCMMLRCQVYKQIGGLDERLFLFSEEPDLCERAASHGWEVAYVPSAEIEHHESSVVSRYPLVKMRHYHLSPLHYFRKRNQETAVMFLKLGFVLELSIKFMVRFVQLSWLCSDIARARLLAYPAVVSELLRY